MNLLSISNSNTSTDYKNSITNSFEQTANVIKHIALLLVFALLFAIE